MHTSYYLPANGRKLECCRNTFMNVHALKRGSINEIQLKLARGAVCFQDGRGKHENRPTRTPENVKAAMLNHIQGFPKYETHYTRATNGPNYLSPDLNLSKMFSLFCEGHPDIPSVSTKSGLYRSIFRSTGLKIGEPKSDTCRTCDLLNVQSKSSERATEREAFKADADLHHLTWMAARKAMNEDIMRSARDPRYVVKCVDLQQVILL